MGDYGYNGLTEQLANPISATGRGRSSVRRMRNV
jgi:hypothetical protein